MRTADSITVQEKAAYGVGVILGLRIGLSAGMNIREAVKADELEVVVSAIAGTIPGTIRNCFDALGINAVKSNPELEAQMDAISNLLDAVADEQRRAAKENLQ
jgi:hypothetical protein